MNNQFQPTRIEVVRSAKHSTTCDATSLTLLRLTILSIVLAGCGRKDNLLPVKGMLTLDGKPLAGATVILIPQGLTGKSACGTAAGDGSFQLATSGRDGALPGDYTVIVGVAALEQRGGDPGKGEAAARRRMGTQASPAALSIPSVYGNASTSPLRCTVPVTGELALELRRTGG
jgi:hypothetical protein